MKNPSNASDLQLALPLVMPEEERCAEEPDDSPSKTSAASLMAQVLERENLLRAYAAATEEQKATLLWVVAKHEIEYNRPALESDVLLIRTWVGKATHRLFERNTQVLRKSDGKLVVKAISHWAPVDLETKRPIKPGKDVYEMFSVHKWSDRSAWQRS